MTGVGLGTFTCVSDAAETILPGIAVDFGGVAQVPEAQVTIVALQSLAWDNRDGNK